MNASHAASLLGIILVCAGILGFFPDAVVDPRGTFSFNVTHNAVHIVTGLALLAGVFLWKPRLTLLIAGIVFVAVAALGFVMPDDRLIGVVAMNEGGRWLHVVLAVVILAAGYWFTDPSTRTPRA